MLVSSGPLLRGKVRHYVLEGGPPEAGNSVRIAGRLINTATMEKRFSTQSGGR
jgi:TolB-like protein